MKNYVVLMRTNQVDGMGKLTEVMISANDLTDLSEKVNSRKIDYNESLYAVFDFNVFMDAQKVARNLYD